MTFKNKLLTWAGMLCDAGRCGTLLLPAADCPSACRVSVRDSDNRGPAARDAAFLALEVCTPRRLSCSPRQTARNGVHVLESRWSKRGSRLLPRAFF